MSVEAPEVLTEKQFEALLKSPYKPRGRLILCFLAHVLRVSEVPSARTDPPQNLEVTCWMQKTRPRSSRSRLEKVRACAHFLSKLGEECSGG
ncbi:hypothetical protein CW705_02750 [Candidatus Bathyarchaeota archaeon]|nr:MAG: hypothetical protein CW705_02750 [Candidatus Bathyarchaeota archaeon]